MKPENLVTTIETSKRLKELGVKQETAFNWAIGSKESNLCLGNKSANGNGAKYSVDFGWQFLSAFTAEEIGELLPEYVKGQHFLEIVKENNEWSVGYRKDQYCGFEVFHIHKSLSEALALTFIQLKEKGII